MRPADGYCLWVRFDDGIAGTVDLASVLHIGCFTLLRDRHVFSTVRVDADTGNLRWPAGVYLHAFILHDDLVARGARRAAPPSDDQAFQKFMLRAIWRAAP